MFETTVLGLSKATWIIIGKIAAVVGGIWFTREVIRNARIIYAQQLFLELDEERQELLKPFEKVTIKMAKAIFETSGKKERKRAIKALKKNVQNHCNAIRALHKEMKSEEKSSDLREVIKTVSASMAEAAKA